MRLLVTNPTLTPSWPHSSASADQAAFVGDSPHDVHSGNAAGVVTIAALWGPFDRETLAAARPNHFIGCMADLPGVLEQAFAA